MGSNGFFPQNEQVKTTHFGAAGMSDYTKHKNKSRRRRYLSRHRDKENWDNYMSAGSLSRYILWNKPTLDASIKAFERKHKVEINKMF